MLSFRDILILDTIVCFRSDDLGLHPGKSCAVNLQRRFAVVVIGCRGDLGRGTCCLPSESPRTAPLRPRRLSRPHADDEADAIMQRTRLKDSELPNDWQPETSSFQPLSQQLSMRGTGTMTSAGSHIMWSTMPPAATTASCSLWFPSRQTLVCCLLSGTPSFHLVPL